MNRLIFSTDTLRVIEALDGNEFICEHRRLDAMGVAKWDHVMTCYGDINERLNPSVVFEILTHLAKAAQ